MAGEQPDPHRSGSPDSEAAPATARPPHDPWAPPQPGSVPPEAGPPVNDPHGVGTWQPSPARPSYDGFAVASLVTGVLCCVPLLGLALGVIALVRIRKREQRGTGLAVAGMALSAAGTLLTVLFFTTGGWAAFREGFAERLEQGVAASSDVAELRAGDCFDEPDAPENAADLDTYEVGGVDKVPCGRPHDGEAYARVELPAGAYPGEGEVLAVLDRRCAEEMSSYSPDAWKLYAHASFHYYYPAEENWALGERRGVCLFSPAEPGDRLTGTLRQDKDALDPHQRAYLKAAGQLNASLARVPLDDIEENVGAYQEWASDVSGHLWRLSQDLHSHAWEGEAAPLAAELGDQADAVRKEWDKLRWLDDVDEFCDQWEAAETALADDTAGTVFALRDELGLAAERPVTTDYQYPQSAQLF